MAYFSNNLRPTDSSASIATTHVPVPLHPRRRRERGYDQAVLLARVLAGRLGARLVRGALVRTLVDGERGAGIHETVWDGRDERECYAA